ncbi:FG-GAP repeat domain-containing protein [Marinoscillum furvescens]|uniref:VCBS repeat protein n=1 Tax=Marinoscillum furvescens DSM 4134 TaxID=1122208 RepID=A0A3D9KZ56_MARFU|nr:VCBS repeat-containing protein [Marinoscillum furvescens]RED92025.1 VCBS repeat protein [Marinoscillum furvescens DSM 4134]
MKILKFCAIIIVAMASCKPAATDFTPVPFESQLILDDARYFWAHCPADLTGDGVADLVFIHNNASGGYLGYYTGHIGSGLWEKVTISNEPMDSIFFAGGDLECADIDGDGDLDVLAIRHPGEWVEAGAVAHLSWFENPSWKEHAIGKVPDAVKDVSFTDFDKDGHMDLAVLTFDESTLSLFQQGEDSVWQRAQYWHDYGNLHEGMAIGDVNGDGYADILATGHAFINPATNLSLPWKTENIHSRWNSQTGDWSRNGTKMFAQDLDGDGQDEVFISHSERAGYPVTWNKRIAENTWEEHVILDSLPACHTLQVYDFDGNGRYDLLAGINKGRAVNLGVDHFELMLLRSEDYEDWQSQIITDEGIYNGQAIDFDGDGDMDFFRYPDHESNEMYLFVNQTIAKNNQVAEKASNP